MGAAALAVACSQRDSADPRDLEQSATIANLAQPLTREGSGCATPDTSTSTLEQPAASCNALARAEALPYPFTGLAGQRPRVKLAEVVGGTLYASFHLRSCMNRTCKEEAGLFRWDGAAAWQPVVQDDADLLIAGVEGDVLWKRSAPQDRQLHRLSRGASADRLVGELPSDDFVMGLAAIDGAFFSLRSPASFATTRLERRGTQGPDLTSPTTLAEIQGTASGLRANRTGLVWTEQRKLVSADLTGKRKREVDLPADTQSTSTQLTERHAYASIEHGAEGAHRYSVCRLDLVTGDASIVVSPRRVCGMAANATHLFWIQSGSDAPGTACNEVWARPIAGGAPALLACDDESIEAVAADAKNVYWFGAIVRRLGTSTL